MLQGVQEQSSDKPHLVLVDCLQEKNCFSRNVGETTWSQWKARPSRITTAVAAEYGGERCGWRAVNRRFCRRGPGCGGREGWS
jgi:hypothetical protein